MLCIIQNLKSNKAAVTPSRGLAVPGTSREFPNIINKILPLPENLQRKLQHGKGQKKVKSLQQLFTNRNSKKNEKAKEEKS